MSTDRGEARDKEITDLRDQLALLRDQLRCAQEMLELETRQRIALEQALETADLRPK